MSEPTSILIVEDDVPTRTFLADNLTADGYDLLVAGTLRDALRTLEHHRVDLAVVDLGLPDGSGLELLRRVRESGGPGARLDARLPMVVLSGRAGDTDRVRGFERGCDDFLAKPFSYGEVRLRGVRVTVSQKEFALLRQLAAEPTRVFTKAELLRDVWGFRAPGATRTLDSHACRLRQKLSARGDRFVVNVWGVGYRLIDGPVDDAAAAATALAMREAS